MAGLQDFEIGARAAMIDAEKLTRMREALEWYGEQARLCRLIHSEGDSGRLRLSEDGGLRARAALAPEKTGGRK